METEIESHLYQQPLRNVKVVVRTNYFLTLTSGPSEGLTKHKQYFDAYQEQAIVDWCWIHKQ